MAPKALVKLQLCMDIRSMERTLAEAKILFHCNNQAVISIWESGTTCAKKILALVCLLYYSAAKCNINVCIAHIAGTENVITDCLSRFQQDKFKKLAPLANPASDNIPTWPNQSFIEDSCCAAILNSTLNMPNLPIWVLEHFASSLAGPFPVSSLILEYVFLHPVITAYFLQDTQSVLIWNSYPTDSPSLHLVCRGIHRQQHDSQRTRLPITINILQLLKEQLRICTHNTPMEKRLLWAAFTLAFYRFFRASELLSNLRWSHITLFQIRYP